MPLTIAYSEIKKNKKRNLVLINNDTYQRETLTQRPIRLYLQFNSIQFNLFYFPSLKRKTIKPQRKKMNRWRRCNEKQKPVKVAHPLQN